MIRQCCDCLQILSVEYDDGEFWQAQSESLMENQPWYWTCDICIYQELVDSEDLRN